MADKAMKHSITINDLIWLHHRAYKEDIDFWLSQTRIDSLVLELGCGHGRVTIPLANSGRKIVGVDRDWQVLSTLDSQLESLTGEIRHRIQLIQADLLDFHSSPVFDAVILPCNTFSTFNQRERMRLLDGVQRSLKPGGFFITSIPNPELGSILTLQPDEGIDQGIAELESQFIHPETGFPVQVSSRLVPTPGGLILEWIYDLLLPDGNVKRYLKSTKHFLESLTIYLDGFGKVGLMTESCLGDFSGAEYDQDSPYLIMTVKKPK